MPQFLIPPSLAPCVYRPGVGTFKPGDILTVEPEEAVGLRFVPLDAAAYAMLVAAFGADKVKAQHGAGPAAMPAPALVVDDTRSLRELDANSPVLPDRVEKTAPKAKPGKRAADR